MGDEDKNGGENVTSTGKATRSSSDNSSIDPRSSLTGQFRSGLDGQNWRSVTWDLKKTEPSRQPPNVNTQASMPPSRHRLNTDGMRNQLFQNRRHVLRQGSWERHRPVRAHDDNYFDWPILTRTSFAFDRLHQVHVPEVDEDGATCDEEEEEEEEDRGGLRSKEHGEEFFLDEINEDHRHSEFITERVETILNYGGKATDELTKKSPIHHEDLSSPSPKHRRRATPWFSWKLFWAYTGPGWLMSVAYLDPGNIESDLQAGGYSGFQLLWVLSISTMLGFFMQVLAARLGVVTGRNLAENCRLYYRSSDTTFLYIMMQLAIIGSDIQEIVGSAIAFRVLLGIPLWAGCLLTGLDTLTFLGLHVIGVRQLELFFVLLIAAMCLCFFATFFEDPADPKDMMEGFFVPYVNDKATVQAVSILGAVVMPHNIYLHSALVLSRDINRRRPSKVREANKYFAIEAGLALFVSLLINAAVVAVFAHGFYSDQCQSIGKSLVLEPSGVRVDPPFACVPKVKIPHGAADQGEYQETSVKCVTEGGLEGSCMPIGLQGAAHALEAFLGKAASTMWAVGLLAAGQSSTMTGTYAGQFVMEGFLQLEIPNWVRVGLTRAISLIPATIVAVLANSNYLAADKLDEMLNVLQSLQLPFALLPLLCFTGSEQFMSKRFVNGKIMQIIGWTSTFVVLIINAYLVYESVDLASMGIPATLLLFVFATVYIYVLVRVGRDAMHPSHLRALHAVEQGKKLAIERGEGVSRLTSQETRTSSFDDESSPFFPKDASGSGQLQHLTAIGGSQTVQEILLDDDDDGDGTSSKRFHHSPMSYGSMD